jgi:hypothetical protein
MPPQPRWWRKLLRKPPTVALALGSGGARGLAHIPVLEALDELGVRPVAVAGASIGAVIGSGYAAGMSGQEIHALGRRRFSGARTLCGGYCPAVWSAEAVYRVALPGAYSPNSRSRHCRGVLPQKVNDSSRISDLALRHNDRRLNRERVITRARCVPLSPDQ